MQHLHNNATTTENLRKLIQETTENYAVFCRRHGISHTTFYRWRKRTFTKDVSCARHTQQKALTPEDEYFIRELYRLTGATGTYIHEVFTNRKNISVSAIYRCLKPIREKKAREYFKFEKYPLGFVHVDVHYSPQINKKKYYLYVAIERNTRYLYMDVYDSKNKKATLLFMQNMLAFYSFDVHTILSDNGLEFKNNEVHNYLNNIGIKHKFIKPYNPRTNGMVERVNRIIDSECIKREIFTSADKMKQAIKNYENFYNTQRYHSALYKELRVKTPEKALKKILFLK
ncbi:MAG: IS481 family transposase [Bacteroidales bacterium]|nr:IS481 family transposase [Bacteroidales bacterium]